VVVGDVVRTISVTGGTLARRSILFSTNGGREVIAIRPHRTFRPLDAAPGGDPRLLGVGVQSLRVRSDER
jgi:hypothetical protein